MDISVIICTHNRSEHLERCLEALAGMDVPSGLDWEVLVVDNNSTDDTKAVSEGFGKKDIFNMKYIFEEKAGLSFARNRGIQEANGRIVAFLDDDSIPAAGWLESMKQTFDEYDADCVGGKILGAGWPKNIPKWFTEELHSYVTIYDKGNKVLQLESFYNTPFGANIAYKKSIFKKTGLFDISIGRQGEGSAYGGEEQKINQEILRKGGKIFYQPDALVYHAFRDDMLQKSYFRRSDFNSGEKAGLIFGEYNKRNILGIPLFIFTQFIRSIFRYLGCIIKNGYTKSFRKELYIWYFLGFMNGRIQYRR